jgi:hypothetical protein
MRLLRRSPNRGAEDNRAQRREANGESRCSEGEPPEYVDGTKAMSHVMCCCVGQTDIDRPDEIIHKKDKVCVVGVVYDVS